MINYTDSVSQVEKLLIIDTSPSSFNRMNEHNYNTSEIQMSFKHYESLIQSLERQGSRFSTCKEKLINVKLVEKEIEFKTISETKDQGTISFDSNDTF